MPYVEWAGWKETAFFALYILFGAIGVGFCVGLVLGIADRTATWITGKNHFGPCCEEDDEAEND